MHRDRYWNLKGDGSTPRDLLQRLPPGARILEVGCGTGLEARVLVAKGFDVRGIDTDAEAIEIAKNTSVQCDRLRFECLDFSRHQFEEEFDAVYERGVLHNVKSDQDRADFAEQVALALKPGGTWFNITGCADDRRYDHRHGCLYLSHLIPPIEELFEVLLVERRPYGPIEAGFDFDAWYCVFQRRTRP